MRESHTFQNYIHVPNPHSPMATTFLLFSIASDNSASICVPLSPFELLSPCLDSLISEGSGGSNSESISTNSPQRVGWTPTVQNRWSNN